MVHRDRLSDLPEEHVADGCEQGGGPGLKVHEGAIRRRGQVPDLVVHKVPARPPQLLEAGDDGQLGHGMAALRPLLSQHGLLGVHVEGDEVAEEAAWKWMWREWRPHGRRAQVAPRPTDVDESDIALGAGVVKRCRQDMVGRKGAHCILAGVAGVDLADAFLVAWDNVQEREPS